MQQKSFCFCPLHLHLEKLRSFKEDILIQTSITEILERKQKFINKVRDLEARFETKILIENPKQEHPTLLLLLSPVQSVAFSKIYSPVDYRNFPVYSSLSNAICTVDSDTTDSNNSTILSNRENSEIEAKAKEDFVPNPEYLMRAPRTGENCVLVQFLNNGTLAFNLFLSIESYCKMLREVTLTKSKCSKEIAILNASQLHEYIPKISPGLKRSDFDRLNAVEVAIDALDVMMNNLTIKQTSQVTGFSVEFLYGIAWYAGCDFRTVKESKLKSESESKIEISKKLTEEIMEGYAAGENVSFLSEKCSLSRYFVRKVLRKNKIKIRRR